MQFSTRKFSIIERFIILCVKRLLVQWGHTVTYTLKVFKQLVKNTLSILKINKKGYR